MEAAASLSPSPIELPTEANPSVLIHGDCLDLLRRLPAGSVDAVITDPPYGISLGSDLPSGRRDRRAVRSYGIANDDSLRVANLVESWAASSDLPTATFASPYNPLPGRWRNVLVWDKGPAVGGGGDMATTWKRTAELICVARNGPLRLGRDGAVLDFPVSPGAGFEHHPCQKPVGLLAYLIRQLTDPGDTVFDPFMGSGSTGVACMQTGRRFIGCEIDAGYFATARRRIDEARGVGGLFCPERPAEPAGLFA